MESNETYPDLIYCVQVNLDSRGLNTKATEIHCKETPKSFVTPTKRISKEKLGTIDTIFNDSHKWFRYTIYCRVEDIEISQSRLTEKVIKKALEVKQELDNVLVHIL
jgi:hypothetical protein